MLHLILIVILAFGTLLSRSAVLPAAEPDPAQAVVRIVCLDDQGHPQRQGLGVVVDQEGGVLTSASLFLPGDAGIVLTGKGEKYLIQEVLYKDAFQDLAVLKMEAGRTPKVDVGLVKRVYPGEALRIALYQDKGVVLQKTRVAKIYPFSSRLILVKLDPPLLEAEPGAPLLDSRGNVVGLHHTLGSVKGAAGRFKVILALGRGFLPREIWLKEKKKSSEREKEGHKTHNDPQLLPKPLDFSPDDRLGDQKSEGDQSTKGENQEVEAYAAFWQGVRASQELKWQEAQEWFTSALDATGELPEAYFGRGVARYHLKNYEGAVQDCLQANRQLSNYALASLWLGKAWERLGDPTQARKAYEQALNQDPDLKEAWFYLGVLAYQEGHGAQAQKFLERSGDGIEEAAQRAYYLGAIARSQGRHEQAQKAFAEAIKLDTGLLPAYLEQGKTLLDLGQPKKAAHVLSELIQRQPESPAARYYLALSHLAAWNTKEAWEQYFILQKLDPVVASRLLPVLERAR